MYIFFLPLLRDHLYKKTTSSLRHKWYVKTSLYLMNYTAELKHVFIEFLGRTETMYSLM
jgi:hypothetical protein